MSGNASTAVPTCQFQPDSMPYNEPPMDYANVGSSHFYPDFPKYNTWHPQQPNNYDLNQQHVMAQQSFTQNYPPPVYYNPRVHDVMMTQQQQFQCSYDFNNPSQVIPQRVDVYMERNDKVVNSDESWHQNDMNQTTQHHGDPCAQVVQVLQCYHQGGEEPEFVRKAIESLVKKLKDKQTELDALISAVTNGGKEQTSCVTIQRSLDGRLQVAGRKGVPHVVYARIWRWPNVNKNELQKMDICRIPNDHPDLICINPFHYERIVSSGYGNLDMNLNQRQSTTNMDYQGGLMLQNPTMNQQPVMPMDMPNIQRYPGDMNGALTNHMEPMPNEPQTYNPPTFPRGEIMNYQETRPSAPESFSNFFMYGPTQQPTCVITHNDDGTVTMTNSVLPSFSNDDNRDWKTSNGFGFGSHNENRMVLDRYNNIRQQIPEVIVQENDYDLSDWCSINYYELDTQIGETFNVSLAREDITIDGGTDPGGGRKGRFCLGALSNVHRTEASERARAGIGKGIKLIHHSNGSVVLECHALTGVFVRSNYLDFENNVIYNSTVHKFTKGATKKIFDLRWAYLEMREQTETAQRAYAKQAQAVAGNRPVANVVDRSVVGVDDLRRVCCTIAISFVKGWGAGYNRTSLKETPCWIELQLHRPLKCLNMLLQN
uniref:Mothers against decapentaplegic homolog n=1 Tax=Panagrolaimus sp. JU765 TaxID=591449 RepID=A0AC34QBC1_9BILA